MLPQAFLKFIFFIVCLEWNSNLGQALRVLKFGAQLRLGSLQVSLVRPETVSLLLKPGTFQHFCQRNSFFRVKSQHSGEQALKFEADLHFVLVALGVGQVGGHEVVVLGSGVIVRVGREGVLLEDQVEENHSQRKHVAGEGVLYLTTLSLKLLESHVFGSPRAHR